MSKAYHQHISKGSMKLSHSLDDRHERSSLGNSAHESKPITPANISQSKIDAIKAAFKARDNKVDQFVSMHRKIMAIGYLLAVVLDNHIVAIDHKLGAIGNKTHT